MPRFALGGDWEKVGEIRRPGALPDSWNSTLANDRNHKTLTRHFSHSIHTYLGSLIALYPFVLKVSGNPFPSRGDFREHTTLLASSIPSIHPDNLYSE